MNIERVYRNSFSALILIGGAALLVFWLGGWAVTQFLQDTHYLRGSALRCGFQLGHTRVPFWPVASLVLMILHGFFMFRYSTLRARLGVPRRWWEGRTGEYDAQLDNPFTQVLAKDLVVIGMLLIAYLILML